MLPSTSDWSADGGLDQVVDRRMALSRERDELVGEVDLPDEAITPAAAPHYTEPRADGAAEALHRAVRRLTEPGGVAG